MPRFFLTGPLNWINKKGYFQGIFWMSMVCWVSCCNDVICKYVGQNLHFSQVSFLRFGFGTLSLLPFVLYYHCLLKLSPQRLAIHTFRAFFLVISLTSWCYGVIILPLPLTTTINFTTPLFVLILAVVFLKETLKWQEVAATFLGFLGILISLDFNTQGFNPMAIVLIISTIFFAALDIVNKILILQDESTLAMLFYSALGTALFIFPLSWFYWLPLSWGDLSLLMVLGINGNLMLFFLLKAFASTSMSSLQPFRYMELIFSCILSFVIFGTTPSLSTLLGAAFIIPASLYTGYHEIKRPPQKTSH